MSANTKTFIHEVKFDNFADFKENYVDIDFPIIVRTTGQNIPLLTEIAASPTGSITAPQWNLNDVNISEGQELIHGWKEGTPVYWHVHVLTNGVNTTDRYLRWELSRVYAPIGSQLVLPSVTITSIDYRIPANTPDKTSLIIPIGTDTLTGAKIGTHIWAILKRVATSNPTTFPAPTGDPWCSMLQIHIQVDTLGSRKEGTKY